MKFFIKPSNFQSILIISSLIFLMGCGPGDDIDIDPCDATKLDPSVQRTFEVKAICKNQDGEPAVGVTIHYEFIKQYCNGNLNGEENHSDVTDYNGYSFSPFVPNYMYTNEGDKVFIKVYPEGAYDTQDVVYRWEDVDEQGVEYIIDLANRNKVIRLFEITVSEN